MVHATRGRRTEIVKRAGSTARRLAFAIRAVMAVTLGPSVVLMALLWPHLVAAAPVPVRFAEGVTHGFLVLRALDGALLAQGDLLQVLRGGQVESRMVFRFKDGSVYDETTVFTQQRVFAMQEYHLVQRGPAFGEDAEISLYRASGKYHVKVKPRNGEREETLDGTLDLPPDVYNGMLITLTKNLPKGASETVHVVAFTPTPRLIQLEVTPAGEQKVQIGELTKTATRYVFKPKLGFWLNLFSRLLGRRPGEYYAWILKDDVPAFVKFEGPLYTTGPSWRIETTTPRRPG